MTRSKRKTGLIDVKGLLERNEDFLRAALPAPARAALEGRNGPNHRGPERGERIDRCLTCRSGYYSRSFMTRVGTLEQRVPQDRAGRLSTELSQRYQRSEKPLVSTGQGTAAWIAISSDETLYRPRTSSGS